MNQRHRDLLVVLKKAQKKLITRKQAAAELEVTERQIRRLLVKLKESGGKTVIQGLRGRAGGVGHLGTRLAGRTRREAVSDPYDRRRNHRTNGAVRTARFDREKHALAVELPGPAWASGSVLHRQGELVSDGAQERTQGERVCPARNANHCRRRRLGGRCARWGSPGSRRLRPRGGSSAASAQDRLMKGLRAHRSRRSSRPISTWTKSSCRGGISTWRCWPLMPPMRIGHSAPGTIYRLR